MRNWQPTYLCLWFWISRHHAVKEHLTRHKSLNLSPCQPERKGCIQTLQFLWVNPHLLQFYKDTQMKPVSPQHFFSFKINECCHCSAHSRVAKRPVSLKEILISQANPTATVSPNNILFSAPVHQPGSWTEVKLARKSQLLLLNVCTLDFAHNTFHLHTSVMIYSLHVFISYIKILL